MAIQTIESWICDQGEFEISFDDVSLSVYFNGPAVVQLSANCDTARGKNFGDTVFIYCDGLNQKVVKSTSINPFFFIDTVVGGCSTCDLVVFAPSKTNPSVAMASDGSIQFTPQTSADNSRYNLFKKIGGIYQLQASDVAMTPFVQEVIGGLNAGEYKVIVLEDNSSCKPVENIYILADGAECDVSFATAVTVDETAPGANDGQATITALGANPVEYSITDLPGSYQVSNVFSGLAPGNYTVYIREQSVPACANTGNFVINPAVGSPPPERVSEVKPIKIKQDCFSHPIYLCWLNSLGGWDYWLFEFDHRNTLKSSAGQDFERPIGEISTQEIVRETINRTSSRRIMVGAENLEEQEFKAIAQMIESRQVYWLRTVNNVVKKLGVKVMTSTLSYNARNELHPIRIEIELPEKFLIS